MARQWIGVALATLGLTTTAAAQVPYYPTSAGQQAAVPEPLPFAPPQHQPPPPQMAMPPQGGPGGLPIDPECGPPVLPANLPNAFTRQSCEGLMPACYVYVGAGGLKRERMGNGTLALFDPNPVDIGVPPPANAPIAASYDNLTPQFAAGPRVTIGYHWDCSAFELNGFYYGEASKTQYFVSPGRLFTYFTNPPVGFEGNNGLWTNADLMRLSLDYTLANIEGNYRFWLSQNSNFSWLVGVRYFDMAERLGILVDDESSILDINGNPDPARRAEYIVRSHNRIVGPQLGMECNKGLTHWFAFSCMAKGVWGLNFTKDKVMLERGDGLIGFNGERADTVFGHLYELGFFADFHLSARARLRAGYDLLWVVGVAEAADQVDYDLAQHFGERNASGSVFYHGPMIELQVVY